MKQISRAAEYMRMSTEHQQYSIANQSSAIREYASANALEIIRTFVDAGKSGLDLKHRPALQSLLQTVVSGAADFSILLVFDVSRWGRFQDVDESAYYEYTLRRAGVRVIYCSEPFRDSDSPIDSVMKTLKRVMAAEYSRELSAKVSQGQRRIAQLGYRLGGVSGFGLRRMAIDPNGSRRTVLPDGAQKAIKTDRVTLVNGPKQERGVVKDIFTLFADQGFGEKRIARHLNERGVRTRAGNRWSGVVIHRMLTNPKYAGDLAYCRTATTMGSPPVDNARENWVYVPNRFPPLIPRALWDRAQDRFEARRTRCDDDVMLGRLKALLRKHGRLSYGLIDGEPGMPSAQTYLKRFGSIAEAYRRVGWKAGTRGIKTVNRTDVRAQRLALDAAVTARIAGAMSQFIKNPASPVWTINGELTLEAALIVPTVLEKRKIFWRYQRRSRPGAKASAGDVLVIARLNVGLDAIQDYYVFVGSCPATIKIFEENAWALDLHRFSDLSFVEMICGTVRVSEMGAGYE
ncbi:MAG TPA: recombinase family protein [Bryobacteraceae bacterium]|nr:recombinase family protein [Bryobacteraceae bacterium]